MLALRGSRLSFNVSFTILSILYGSDYNVTFCGPVYIFSNKTYKVL
jgi:hypothetical protein